MISKGFGLVAFFASVKASSICILLELKAAFESVVVLFLEENICA
jgi:hypothetical protein